MYVIHIPNSSIKSWIITKTKLIKKIFDKTVYISKDVYL